MKRPPSSLQFEQWPPGDRALWAAAFAAGEFLQPTGRAAHWAPATAKQVQKGYAKWLGYLHLSNLLDIDATPSERVSEDILEGFVLWMKSHDLASTTIASRVTDLHEALRVMKPTTDHTVLSRLIPVLRARETPSRDKHTRIRHPDDLLKAALGQLDKIPTDPASNEKIRATKYRDSLAFAFLVCRPIRLKNFAALRLGHHLCLESGKWYCRLDASETKEKAPIEFTLPACLDPYLATYLDRFRPLLLDGTADDHLWISIRRTPVSGQAIYCNTCDLTKRLFGVRINPHLLRDCAASAMATDDPEHILAAARILGHASLQTTNRHYNQSQMIAAGRRYQSAIIDLRRAGLDETTGDNMASHQERKRDHG